MFSEKTKEYPLFLLRLSNLHQTLAAMFKHCKHRDKFSIHKIFSEKFLPGRAFFQNPFLFSSSPSTSFPFSVFTSVNTFHISLYPPSPFFTLSPSSPKPPIAILQFFLLLSYPLG